MVENLRRNLYNSTGSKKSARNVLSCTGLNQVFDQPCVQTELANQKTCGRESRSSLDSWNLLPHLTLA